MIVRVDNTAAAAMINNGTTRHPVALDLLKRLAASALEHDYTIEAVYIPGAENTIPDAISRLHEPGQFHQFISNYKQLYPNDYLTAYCLPHHMSHKCLSALLPQILSYLSLNNWMTRSASGDRSYSPSPPRNVRELM